MARYTGPKSRIARRFGEPIFGPDKVLSKKSYAPGQHGNSRRRKTSEYGTMWLRSRKQNTLTVFSRNSSAIHLQRQSVPKVLQVKCVFSFSKSSLVSTTLFYRLGIAPTRAGARAAC